MKNKNNCLKGNNIDKYIDIHTHILHDVDDGSKDVCESLKLIKEEKDNNVDMIVLTPHFYSYEQSIDNFLKKRDERVSCLKSYSFFPLIKGSEVFLSKQLAGNKDVKKLCIEGTRYILIELPCFSKWDKNVLEYVNEIILNYQLIPIIAHIERYKFVRFKYIKEMRENGCLIQVNSSSFYSKHCFFVRKLAKKKLIDLIASDCHNLGKRRPNILRTMVFIQKKYKDTYKQIMKNFDNIRNDICLKNI